MDRFGFIHEKLDIKILILYILQRLPEAVDGATLSDLTLCDEGISYFDYVECLNDLIDTGHVAEDNGEYKITEKGIRNGNAIESSLPYSVRSKAERAALTIATAMRRDSMINTSRHPQENGGYTVELSLADGMGEIISLRLLAAGEDQAEQIEKNFRRDAEGVYNHLIDYLLNTK